MVKISPELLADDEYMENVLLPHLRQALDDGLVAWIEAFENALLYGDGSKPLELGEINLDS